MSRKLAYTVKEAAAMLSISRTLLYELMNAGKIASVRFGRSRRITETSLQEFLTANQDESIFIVGPGER